VFLYAWRLFKERYPLPIGFINKASISAFNFYTIFFKIDIDFSNIKLLGIASSLWGLIFYAAVNLVAFLNYLRQKNKLIGMISGLFIIGMGNFLFLTGMMERYFFPALAPMVVLMFTYPKMLIRSVIVNLILFANIIYSFYRRGSDEIAYPFTNYNFLLMRALSLTSVLIFFTQIRLLMLQFIRGRS
jgi:hypothetical protein